MADKIRIALVYTSANSLGGENSHLKSLYLNLDKDEFKVFIFCCSKVKSELRDLLIQEGIQREDLVLISRWKKWIGIPLILELKKLFEGKKIDIVHTVQMQSDIFGVLAARLAGIKNVFSLFESKTIPDNVCLAKKMFYRIAGKVTKKWFARTVAVSNGLREELVSQGFRPANRIEVIPLGFEIPEKYRNFKPLFTKLKERNPVIGSMSRLSKEKGVDRFIAAMPYILQKEPKASFVITSKGPEEKKLEKQVERLGLTSKVTFAGWVKDGFSTMESIDIFVMPSLREGCPIALFEALALSRPVVASRIKGILDIIDDGEDGVLVDTTNPKEFAERVVFLCQNPEKAISLGKKGYAKLTTKFTMDSEISKMKQLYLDGCFQS